MEQIFIPSLPPVPHRRSLPSSLLPSSLSFLVPRFYRAMHVVLARYCYRKLSVCPSVCLSVCDINVPWTYKWDSFEINYTSK